MHQIKIEKFEGPFALLLDLIEQNKLDIAEVSLSEVADQYLAKIEANRDYIKGEELADFLLVAAKLLFIKSRLLLPELMVSTDNEDSLEAQLKMYKAYRDAAANIKIIINEKNFTQARRPFKLVDQVQFSPPEKITVDILYQKFRRIMNELEKTIVRLPKATLRKTISLAERIGDLKSLLSKATQFGFRDFLSQAKNKSEVVVSFLALLELIKQKHVFADQPNEDIIITKINSSS